LNSKLTLSNFFEYLCEKTYKKSRSSRIRLDAEYLDHKDENLTLEKLEMLPNDYLFIEIPE